MFRAAIAAVVLVALSATGASTAAAQDLENRVKAFRPLDRGRVGAASAATPRTHSGKSTCVRLKCVRSHSSGKEADDEVGVVYFGERYLIPRLARWASPDPLAIHAVEGGEALNAYHYVSGNLLQARDPIGLDVKSSTLQLTDHQGSGQSVTVEGNAQANVVGSRIQASVRDNERGIFATSGNEQVLTAGQGEAAWAQYNAWRASSCDDTGCRGDSGLSQQAIMWMSMIKDDVVHDIHPIDLQGVPQWVRDRVAGTRLRAGDPTTFTTSTASGYSGRLRMGQQAADTYVQGATLVSSEIASRAGRRGLQSSGQSGVNQVFYLYNQRGLDPSVIIQSHEAFHSSTASWLAREGGDPSLAGHRSIDRELYNFMRGVAANAFGSGVLSGNPNIQLYWQPQFSPGRAPNPRGVNWCGSGGRCFYPRARRP